MSCRLAVRLLSRSETWKFVGFLFVGSDGFFDELCELRLGFLRFLSGLVPGSFSFREFLFRNTTFAFFLFGFFVFGHYRSFVDVDSEMPPAAHKSACHRLELSFFNRSQERVVNDGSSMW